MMPLGFRDAELVFLYCVMVMGFVSSPTSLRCRYDWYHFRLRLWGTIAPMSQPFPLEGSDYATANHIFLSWGGMDCIRQLQAVKG